MPKFNIFHNIALSAVVCCSWLVAPLILIYAGGYSVNWDAFLKVNLIPFLLIVPTFILSFPIARVLIVRFERLGITPTKAEFDKFNCRWGIVVTAISLQSVVAFVVGYFVRPGDTICLTIYTTAIAMCFYVAFAHAKLGDHVEVRNIGGFLGFIALPALAIGTMADQMTNGAAGDLSGQGLAACFVLSLLSLVWLSIWVLLMLISRHSTVR